MPIFLLPIFQKKIWLPIFKKKYFDCRYCQKIFICRYFEKNLISDIVNVLPVLLASGCWYLKQPATFGTRSLLYCYILQPAAIAVFLRASRSSILQSRRLQYVGNILPSNILQQYIDIANINIEFIKKCNINIHIEILLAIYCQYIAHSMVNEKKTVSRIKIRFIWWIRIWNMIVDS